MKSYLKLEIKFSNRIQNMDEKSCNIRKLSFYDVDPNLYSYNAECTNTGIKIDLKV